MKINLGMALCISLLTGFCNMSSAQRLDGLYRSFNVVRVGPGAIPAQAYLFYPNGEVYKGIPLAESTDKFDFARAKRETPALCGTYTIANGQITFNWADGKTENSYFNYRVGDGGKEEIGFKSTFWVKLINWDKQLNGEYESSSLDLGFPGKTDGFPDFATGSQLSIAFTADGKFTAKQRRSTDAGSYVVNDAGSYVVKGAILRLNFSDGSTRDCTLHVFADSSKETRHEILYINGRPYILKSLL
jgi:hypothetical protein